MSANPQTIQSEAKLTTFEAISMIVGNSIGTGIIAVPYLATKNSMLDVVWMVLIAYCVNVILHLINAELSYNNGGAQIFVNWFGMPFVAAQVLYYVIAGVVVFIGMKAVGIAQKYAVIVLMGIVAVMTVWTFLYPLNSLHRAQFHWNNLLALYSMVVFATSVMILAGVFSLFAVFGVNSFIVLTRIMTYGMSIDYLGYSGIAKQYIQRGATLITRKTDGNKDINMVPLTSVVSTRVRGA